MVKIALISDTHGYMDDKIAKYLNSCSEVWHAGDIGTMDIFEKLSSGIHVRAVYGNIDDQQIRNTFPEYLFLDIEGKKILMTHIGGLPPKYNRKVRNELRRYHPDIFICGHSHMTRIMTDDVNNLLYINPGAAGQQGFHKIRTMVRFTIDNRSLRDLQVIELGKRGKLA